MWKSIWSAKRMWIGYAVTVAALHAAGIAGLFTAARGNSAFWLTGLLAYTLGMRHAFDVDHIAAIDNTVRKLVQQKKNPLGVGFYFSLGHSSVVFIMVLAVAFSMKWVKNEMPFLQEIGGTIGTTVSGLFLVVIGLINLLILVNLLRVFRTFRSGSYDNDHLEKLLASRGFISRMIQPLLAFIGKSWHVYPLGFLFGLGFDTATEVGLLAISATAAQTSISLFGILSLPLLFAAGMSLLDTADGMFMSTAYRWAFSTPLRKLYYNFTVTAVSVIAALLIGLVELSQVASEKLGLTGSFWIWLQQLDFGQLGIALAVLFVFAWAVSITVWKLMERKQASVDS